MRPVKFIRRALWVAVERIIDLSDGSRYMHLVRLLVKLDAPLRRSLLRGIHAKPATR